MDLQTRRPIDSRPSAPAWRVDSSAGKALVLLDALAGPRASLGVSELAALTGLPKSSVHRLLVVLVEGGYVRRLDGKYALSSRVFEIGNQCAIARSNGLREVAIPFMAELFAQTHETIHLAVRVGTDVLYVDKLYGHDSVRTSTCIGARRPDYATGLGKAMLAYAPPEEVRRSLAGRYRRFTAYTIATPEAMHRSLRRVREEGWATDNEESFLGVCCVAVPVLDRRTQHAVAALSLTTSVGRSSVQRYRSLLLRAGAELSTALGAVAA